jgi:hypothetical protein
MEEGRRLFRVGVALLQDPDGARYEDARIQFQRAYDLTRSWKVLGNLGLCQLKLERDGEAIESYEKYLAEGGDEIDAGERAQIGRDVAVLKAQVAHVKLTLPEAGVLVIDERSDVRGGKIINEYAAAGTTLELGIHPGRHEIVARKGGRESRWSTQITPGSTVEHGFEWAADASAAPAVSGTPATTPATADRGVEESSRPVPATVWVAAGITGALTIGAAATGVIALSKRSDFDAINDSSHSEAEKKDAHDSATSMGMLSTVLTGAAIAGAGVTAYLFFTRPEQPEKQHGRALVAPWVGAHGGGLMVRGSL